MATSKPSLTESQIEKRLLELVQFLTKKQIETSSAKEVLKSMTKNDLLSYGENMINIYPGLSKHDMRDRIMQHWIDQEEQENEEQENEEQENEEQENEERENEERENEEREKEEREKEEREKKERGKKERGKKEQVKKERGKKEQVKKEQVKEEQEKEEQEKELPLSADPIFNELESRVSMLEQQMQNISISCTPRGRRDGSAVPAEDTQPANIK